MNLKKNVGLQLKDWMGSLLVFWGIMLTLNILFQFILNGFSFYLGDMHISFNLMDILKETTKDDEWVVESTLFAPYINITSAAIYMLVAGIISGTNTFALLRGLGFNRVSSWISITLSLFIVSVINTVIHTVISLTFAWIIGHQEALSASLDVTNFLTLITIYFLVASFFFMFGTIFYQYGAWFGVISIAALVMAMNFWPSGYDIMDYTRQSYPLLLSWILIAGAFFVTGHILYRTRIK
ncbi:hypothetical protein [Paenibacillus sp. 1001270B_150601_E10]|uniref:hypothetical protein n=1 Tax=Paenibacillus sp. 1001270B_150601_E10 TaxID=2787079 RepID=UPI00189C65AB|nr:hypothetical protein [Paenibacillus sp. 1001270B_150601_E10]